MDTVTFEPAPRWPGAPPTCAATSRQAFEDEKAVRRFAAENCPHYTVTRTWTCGRCGKVHFDATLSGDDARSSTGVPPSDIPFLGTRRAKPPQSSRSSRDLLTPREEPKREEKPRPRLPKQDDKRKEGLLFS